MDIEKTIDEVTALMKSGEFKPQELLPRFKKILEELHQQKDTLDTAIISMENIIRITELAKDLFKEGDESCQNTH